MDSDDVDMATAGTVEAPPPQTQNELPEAAMARLAALYEDDMSTRLAQGSEEAPSEDMAAPDATLATSSNTAQVGGMSISLPFSSHSQVVMPSLPPTRLTSEGEYSTTHTESEEVPDSEVAQQADVPQPLAVKPTYKKRTFIPSAKPDGILRKSGSAAAQEKQLLERRSKTVSIYDNALKEATATRAFQPSSPVKRIRRKPAPSSSTATSSATTSSTTAGLSTSTAPSSSVTTPNHSSPSKKQRTVFVAPPQDTEALKASRKLAFRSLRPPVNRNGPIEALVRQQGSYRERLAQLAARPMPQKELQTLISNELEEEDSTLKSLALNLHKELLKLQLEEGVLMNMLELTKDGMMLPSDMERTDQRKILKTPVAVKLNQIPSRPTPPEHGSMARPFRIHTPVHLDEGDLDQDEVEDTFGESNDAFDLAEDEQEPSRPLLQLPGESYTSRPTWAGYVPTQGLDNQPTQQWAGLATKPSLSSLDEIKRLAVARGKKRALDGDGDEVMADEEYELEFDEEEDESQGKDVGGEGEEGEEDEEEDEEGSSEEQSEEDDGDDLGDYDEEDEDATRDALQRMLAQYGAFIQ